MYLTAEEFTILSNQDSNLFKLYAFLKSKMNKINYLYDNISYSEIQRFMNVPSRQGKKSIFFSKDLIKNLINSLMKLNLIKRSFNEKCIEFIQYYCDYHKDNNNYQKDNKIKNNTMFTTRFTTRFTTLYPQIINNNFMFNNNFSKFEQKRFTTRFTPMFTTEQKIYRNVEKIDNLAQDHGNILYKFHYQNGFQRSTICKVVVDTLYVDLFFNCKYKIINYICSFEQKLNKNDKVMLKKNTIFDKDKVKIKKIIEDDKQKIKENFLKFWEIYPRQVSKKLCEQKFIETCKNNIYLSELIVESIKKYSRIYKYRAHDKIPYPLRWLREERWNDNIENEFNEIF